MRPPGDTVAPNRIGRDDKLGGLPDRHHPFRFQEAEYRRCRSPILVTCVAREGAPTLCGAAAEIVLRLLVEKAGRHALTVHAWCAMPDHVHFVISAPTGRGEFAAFMRLFKSACSREINKALDLTDESSKFRWQRSYWDTFGETAADVAAQIEYVLCNPVEDELCARPADWPYSGALERP